MFFLIFLLVSVYPGVENAVLLDDISEQLVFIKTNLKKIELIEKDFKTSVLRGIKKREDCIRTKIIAFRVLEQAMLAEKANNKYDLERVLRLRKLNDKFSKINSELELCLKKRD